MIAVFALGLVVAGYLGVQGAAQPRRAAVPGDRPRLQRRLRPSQTRYAATITALAVKRGLPPRAATIAIATAIQESKLRNLRYGDRDSIGLFQQRRPRWGTEQQILDPVYSTNRFYDALVKVKGYESMEIEGRAGGAAQRLPGRTPTTSRSRILASALSGHSPGGLGCRLDAADSSDAAALVTELEASSGSAPRARARPSSSLPTRRCRPVGRRLGSGQGRRPRGRAGRVEGREWARTRDQDGWEWQPASDGAAKTVTITLAG